VRKMDLIHIYRSALDCIKEAVCICDQEFKMLYMNPAAIRLTGWSLDKTCKESILNVLGDLDPSGTIKEVICSKEPISAVQIKINGELFSFSVLPLMDNGRDCQNIIITLKHICIDSAGTRCFDYFLGCNEPCPTCGVIRATETKDVIVTKNDLTNESQRPVQTTSIPFQDEINVANQQLHQIIEFLPDATFVIDRNKKVIAWNRAIEEMTGVCKDEIVGYGNYAYSIPFYGRPRPMLVDLIDSSDKETESTFPFVERKGDKLYTEVFVPSLFCGRGAYLWAIASPLYDSDGNRSGYVETLRDITDKKLSSRELEKRDILLSGVAVAANALLMACDFDAGVNQALEILGLCADVDRVYIFENHDDLKTGEHLMSQRFEWCRDTALAQIDNPYLQNISYNRFFPGWYGTLGSGEPVNGLAKDFPDSKRILLERQDIISVLVVPIMIEGRFWGFIGFDECHTERIWTKSEIAILKASAGSIGASIVHKHAEEKLRESEEKFRTLFNNASDAIFIYNLEGHFFEVNQAACDRLGYSRDELLKMTLADLEHPTYSAKFLERIGEVIDIGHSIFETFQVRRDGSLMPVEMNARLIEYKGNKAILCASRDISERKKVEKELRETRDFLENLISHANAPIIVWDPNLKITRFNQAFERLTGRRAQDVLGKPLEFLFPPESRNDSMADIRRTLSGELWEAVEIPVLRMDGTVRTVLWNSATLYDKDGAIIATIAQGQDITDRKLAEEQILFQASLLGQVRNAIVATDLAGNIIYWNKFAENIYQWCADEILGKNISMTIVPADRIERTHQVIEEIRRTGYSEGEFLVKRKDGSIFPAYYIFNLLKDACGKDFGFVSVSTDITERKRAEEDLRDAKERAESATKAKSEFLANMSHEIRTPMNAVIGMTGLLLDTELSLDQRDFVETIRSSGDSLLSLINNILDFSKIEGGKLEIEKLPFNLAECIEASIDLVAEMAARKGLSLSYSIDYNVPPTIMGDVTRLRQVLVNLLSNAVKFTESGEVSIFACSKKNGIFNEIHFSVNDSGIGIEKDHIERLFHSFSQLDSSITRKHGGSGLGLAISKRLVEMMGGKIWAVSSPDEGSTFHFTIEAESARDSGYIEQKPKIMNTYAIERHTLRVLLVEDNLVNQKVALLMLERIGYRADVAANGLEALKALDMHPYDIVFMDVQMPEMDGLEASRQIRMSPGRQPYIIAMTAHALKGDREMCIESGMDDYISKPVKIEELQMALEKAQRRQMALHALDPKAIADLRRLQIKGEPDILAELGGLFLDRAPARITAMRDALANGDAETLYREAHNLKSSSANLGAMLLSAICRELEKLGRSGALDKAPDLINQAISEYERVRLSLQAEISKGNSFSKPPGS
jgi:PAS domain S-box-containing protein